MTWYAPEAKAGPDDRVKRRKRSVVHWRKRWDIAWNSRDALWNMDPDHAFTIIDGSPTLELWDEHELGKHEGGFGGVGDIPVDVVNDVIEVDTRLVDDEPSMMARAVAMSLDASPDEIATPVLCDTPRTVAIFCCDPVDNLPNQHDPKELNWAWYESLDIRNQWDTGQRMRRVANWSTKSDRRFHPAAIRERYFEDHEERLRHLEETF